MKTYLRASLMSAVMLTAAAAAHGQVSIGIAIGSPPPLRVVYVEPPAPGPEFVWVEGYWYPIGNHYRWHDGYWTRPPYEGAHWVAPHHDGERYFAGYWVGDRGRVDHDHHWDRGHDRDFHEDHDHGNGHGNGHAYGHDH